jgi:hypothetical protein
MIGVGLDLLLIVLLVGALYLGMRLEKKLRYLRETQAGFAGAAAELNMALARAEGGLAEMKHAAAEAQMVLGDRLQDGRALAARLDQRMALAKNSEERLELKAEAAERAAAGLDAMIRKAGDAERSLERGVERSRLEFSSPARGGGGGEADGGGLGRAPARPLRPFGTPPPQAGEEKALSHLARLRRDAIAKRAAATEELVLDAPVTLKPAALSRRPGRTDDDLFEPGPLRRSATPPPRAGEEKLAGGRR